MTTLDQFLSFIGQVVLYEGSSSDATLNRPLVCRRSMAAFGRFLPNVNGRNWLTATSHNCD